MQMRIVLVAVLVWSLLSPAGFAAGGGGGYPHDSVTINLENSRSLQRGARLFVNYCMGCHSANLQRYSRMAEDIGISDTALLENLIFNPNGKKGDMMETAMDPADGEKWFGAAPPDLSVIARARGADFLYNYMRAFHLDAGFPMGVNNSVKTVSMPHVLWELQGWRKAEIHSEVDDKGNQHDTVIGLKPVTQGEMNEAEYDRAITDLVNFMVYIGEPIQLERRALGVWVVVILMLAAVLFYLLKKEYWRDVH